MEPLRGISARLRRAAKRSSGGSERSSAIALRRARFGAMRFANSARRLFLLTELVFAMLFSASTLADEGQLESGEQCLRFRVGSRRGADDDVHAAHGIDLVVI